MRRRKKRKALSDLHEPVFFCLCFSPIWAARWNTSPATGVGCFLYSILRRVRRQVFVFSALSIALPGMRCSEASTNKPKREKPTRYPHFPPSPLTPFDNRTEVDAFEPVAGLLASSFELEQVMLFCFPFCFFYYSFTIFSNRSRRGTQLRSGSMPVMKSQMYCSADT